MPRFNPFEDESAALTVGDLSVENRTDRVSVYGSLDITRDREGLRRARLLKGVLADIEAALAAEGDALPEAVEPPQAVVKANNPFGP